MSTYRPIHTFPHIDAAWLLAAAFAFVTALAVVVILNTSQAHDGAEPKAGAETPLTDAAPASPFAGGA
jgi:hypothetical protein